MPADPRTGAQGLRHTRLRALAYRQPQEPSGIVVQNRLPLSVGQEFGGLDGVEREPDRRGHTRGSGPSQAIVRLSEQTVGVGP